MKYLKKYTSNQEYTINKDSVPVPNICYVKEGTTVDEIKWRDSDYFKNKYFGFNALETGTFTLSIPGNIDSNYMTSVSYSTDNGETWITTTVNNTSQTITTPTINAGNKVLWKGVGKQMSKSSSANNFSYFSSTGNFNVHGNIMSLLYGDNFQNNISFNSGSNYNFSNIFKDAIKLTNAVNLILPATTLANYCYQNMFYNCTSLTTTPKLPATTLATYCYYNMFNGCTSLTTAPVLPATTLANYCYQSMFSGCTSLTIAPELPATKLVSDCYSGMFYNCTSLTSAPVLSAKTLTNCCYQSMFYGCKSLTTAPELPAKTLASSCYNAMFYGCKSLTTAPELPATTLKTYCYSNMFNGCTNLNYIKAMFTTTPSTSYTQNWVYGVSANGTFIKNSTANWDVSGVNGIPSGWTVQTAVS